MVSAQNALFEQLDNFIPSIEKEAKELFELSGSESAEIYYKIESTSHNLHALPWTPW